MPSKRNPLQDFYREARASYLREQRQALEAERTSAAQQLQAKQEELEMLKDELAVSSDALRQSQQISWNACARVSALGERLRERAILKRIFAAWLADAKWEQREKVLWEKASTWCDTRGSV